MHIQELEEIESQEFAFGNELQAAFAYGRTLDRAERNDDRFKVADVVDAGLYAICVSIPRFCRFTDACNGTSKFLMDVASTPDEARAKAAELDAKYLADGYIGEEVISVEPSPYLLPAVKVPAPYDPNECPF